MVRNSTPELQLVGAALVEPIVYSGQQALQSDYDMASSLLNIGFGAVMGAALRPAAGQVGEWLSHRRGLIQPWEMAASTDETEALRTDMANRIEQAFLSATGDADSAHKAAQGMSVLFDIRAREWAYDQKKPVQDYYAQHGAKFVQDQAQQGPDNAVISLSQDAKIREAVEYEQTRMGPEALTRLEADAKAFKRAVGRLFGRHATRQPIPMLSQAPAILRVLTKGTELGEAVAKGGLYISGHALDGHHNNVRPHILKQIPQALVDPIAVFRSVEEVDGRLVERKNNLVFMLEVTDDRGATVVVPIELSASKDKRKAVINIVKSAYAKNTEKGNPRIQWFVDQIQGYVDSDGTQKRILRYVNEKKLEQWSGAAGVQFPFRPSPTAHEEKIFSLEDFVKLRDENPQGERISLDNIWILCIIKFFV